MDIERILITGCSGFYGRALIPALRQRWPNARILGLDMALPVSEPPDEFVACDVTSEQLVEEFQQFRPDTVIHLAFIVNPIRDEVRMHAVNVGGTRNVLQATVRCGASRLLVSSSATAYGAWPENPVPLVETHPVRARDEYRYARDKVEVERLLSKFETEHPRIAVSWTRPCMIYGSGVSNYLITFITKGPLIVYPGGNNTELQFVHLEDLGRATTRILEADARGPFNIAPPDWFTLRDLSQFSDRWSCPLPMFACLTLTNIWWTCRLPVFHFPSGLWYFLRYPWVIAPERLTRELGFEFRYSSVSVVKQLLYDHGMLSRKHPLDLEFSSEG